MSLDDRKSLLFTPLNQQLSQHVYGASLLCSHLYHQELKAFCSASLPSQVDNIRPVLFNCST